MNKLGKEAKVLLYGITITCVISFLLAFGISSLMAKEYQKDLMQHDYLMPELFKCKKHQRIFLF